MPEKSAIAAAMNVTAKTVTNPAAKAPGLPFSGRPRTTSVQRIDRSLSFAFNYAAPTGVVLLGNRLAARLRSEAPAPGGADREDAILRRLGLAGEIEKPAPAPPRELDFWIHLVHGCNLACSYCYVPHLERNVLPSETAGHSMKQEAIEPMLRSIFDYCRAHQVRRVGFKFAGGEPTLNSPLMDYFCDRVLALREGVRTSFGIITNGTFGAAAIDILTKHKFNVSISMDGNAAAHDAIRYVRDEQRQRHGTFASVMANVDALLERGVRPYFLFTVSSSNLETIEEFSASARARRLGFRLSLVRHPLPPSPALMERTANYLTAFYRQLGETQPIDLPIERFARFAEWNLSKNKSLACSSGRTYFAIDQLGRLATCQMTMDAPLGTLLEEPLEAIFERFNSDPAQRTLSSPTDRSGPCSRCEFYKVCAGGCPQHTRKARGSFEHASPWCQVYGRLLPVYIESVARQMARAYQARS